MDCDVVTFGQYSRRYLRLLAFLSRFFYELLRTVFGAAHHNRHARQPTPRTSFGTNFFDNEEGAKQNAEGCVFAKTATHELLKEPLAFLRTLLFEISCRYFYVGRSFG